MIAHLLDAAEQQQRWQSLAMIDEVSRLPNRRYLMHALQQLIQRAAQQRFRVTVLALDLDGFKHFNDTYGHAAGDHAIQALAPGTWLMANCWISHGACAGGPA